MLFIHGSEIKCHGNLTSANCVVDSRFTLKITDFGIPLLQSVVTQDSEETFYKKQLWRAPELQSSYGNVSQYTSPSFFIEGTQKGDVFSFGIIMQEILYRQGVFYLSVEDRDLNFGHEQKMERFVTPHDSLFLEQPKLKYKDIFERSRFGLRPSLERDICSKEIIDLLKRCWSVSITERPDFNTIKDTMRKTTK